MRRRDRRVLPARSRARRPRIAAGVVAGAGELNVGIPHRGGGPRARSVGDNICFALGHFLGDRVVNRFFKGEKSQERLAWARGFLDARGGYLIVVARFIPGGRTVTTFTAGFVETFPWRRFPFFDVIAGMIWGTYTVLLGYFGGKTFEEEPWKGSSSGSGSRSRSRQRWRRLAPAGSTGRPPLSPRSRMPRCATIAAVSASTTRAQQPVQPVAPSRWPESSSGGARKICTVPTNDQR